MLRNLVILCAWLSCVSAADVGYQRDEFMPDTNDVVKLIYKTKIPNAEHWTNIGGDTVVVAIAEYCASIPCAINPRNMILNMGGAVHCGLMIKLDSARVPFVFMDLFPPFVPDGAVQIVIRHEQYHQQGVSPGVTVVKGSSGLGTYTLNLHKGIQEVKNKSWKHVLAARDKYAKAHQVYRTGGDDCQGFVVGMFWELAEQEHLHHQAICCGGEESTCGTAFMNLFCCFGKIVNACKDDPEVGWPEAIPSGRLFKLECDPEQGTAEQSGSSSPKGAQMGGGSSYEQLDLHQLEHDLDKLLGHHRH